MPIILAIQPDRRQAAHLAGIVRQRVGAELILADTTEGALDAIGNRIPDLVLVPALLSPQDDAALAAALRVIAAAAHVRTLTIPLLSNGADAVRTGGGMLAKWRRGRSESPAPDGCDPAVFAEQITAYLQEAAAERAALEPAFGTSDEIESFAPDTIEPYATATIEPLAADPIDWPMAEPVERYAATPIESPMFEPIEPFAATAIDWPAAALIDPPTMAAIASPAEPEAETWSEPAAAQPTIDLSEALAELEEEPVDDVVVEEAGEEYFAGEPFGVYTISGAVEETALDVFADGAVDAAAVDEAAIEAAAIEAAVIEELARQEAAIEQLALAQAAIEAAAVEAAAVEAAAVEAAAQEAAAREAAAVEAAAEEAAAREAAAVKAAAVEAAAVQAAALQAAAFEAAALEAAAVEAAAVSALAVKAAAVKAAAVEAAAVEAAALKAASMKAATVKAAALAEAALQELRTKAEMDEAGFDGFYEEPEPARPVERYVPMHLTPVQLWPRLEGVPIELPSPKSEHPEWLELIASLREDIERRRNEPAQPPTVAARIADAALGKGIRPVKKPKMHAKEKPIQDEWGFFDPEQCGFSALLAKLDEITDGAEESEPRRPS